MNAKSLPPQFRYNRYIKYSLANSKMEYLCGVTRKNCYFLYYRTIGQDKWHKYPEVDVDNLKFNLGEQNHFLKNKMAVTDLCKAEFFAELL